MHRLFFLSSMDLFSFLEDGPQENEVVQDGAMDREPPSESTRKRKVASPERENSPRINNDATHTNGSAKNGEPEAGPSSKRPRVGSPKPMVVDEVEIEAKREVAASAGLTGAVEAGSRLELKHQVRFAEFYGILLHPNIVPQRCATK